MKPLLKGNTIYSICAWLLVVVFTFNQTGIAVAQNAPPMQLKITILEGEGALNNIRERTAREPIVQVEDENHKPVAGALVLFTIHGQGAGADFANSLATYQTTTDEKGQATAKGLRPNLETGDFVITVTATVGAATAEAVIHQRNVDPNATEKATTSHTVHHIPSAANIAFIGALAAVAGVLAWGAASSNSGPSTTTITTGTGGVGPPSSTAGAARR
jgi:hypothetical protein